MTVLVLWIWEEGVCEEVRELIVWFIHTMKFHVPCGSCKHVVCFLLPLLQAACKGDSKWNKFAVSYKNTMII